MGSYEDVFSCVSRTQLSSCTKICLINMIWKCADFHIYIYVIVYG